MTFTFVDLFAGIGGFHAALEELGGQCVLAVEKDEEAARVYQDNWGIDPRGDVTLEGWTRAWPGKVDMVVGGFPCQPFSKGGAQRGMAEARGTLFFNVLEALVAWEPELVLLENVRNLLGPKHTHTWEVILRELRALGYAVATEPLVVSPHWLPAARGGAPQSRERVFILATRVGADLGGDPWGQTVQLPSRPGTWDLELDLPLQSSSELGAELEDLACSSEELSWISAWGEFVRLARGAGVELPGHPIWVDAWRSSSWPAAPAWKTRFEQLNQAFYLGNQSWIDPWLESSGVLGFPASRRKLEWQAQDAPGLASCLVQLRPSGLRVKKATHAGALVAIDQRPILPWQGRRLSVRECARLQGFPEWFDSSSVSSRAAARQFGNAVNVGVVRWVVQEHLGDPRVRAALEKAGSPLLEVRAHDKAPA